MKNGLTVEAVRAELAQHGIVIAKQDCGDYRVNRRKADGGTEDSAYTTQTTWQTPGGRGC